MRLVPLLALAALSACSNSDKWAENVATPTLTTMTEQPGDWSSLDGMINRRPSESGLLERSPVNVDIEARLGASAQPFRNAMMAAGPLRRRGDLLVSEGPDAWLVLNPAEHAFRAGLVRGGQLQEWQTAGADVPRPN